jgi:hypothetical protein
VSGPSTVHILSSLEINEWGGFLCTEGDKVTEDLEDLLLAIVWINLAQHLA